MTFTSSGEHGVRRLFVCLTVAALALLGVSLNTVQASAADRPGTIKTVVVNPDASGKPSGKPINLYDGIAIAATWAAPAGTKSGDTFSMALPPQISGTAATFPLIDKQTGETVGNCVVKTTEITCTFNDYVNTHEDVTGSLGFYARAMKTSSETQWDWNVGNNVTITTAQPGGVGPYVPKIPTVSNKGGWMLTDGNIQWAIYLLGKDVVGAEGSEVKLTDTYDKQLTLVPDSFTVQQATAAEITADTWKTIPQGTAPGTYTATFDPAGASFTTTIHGADPAMYYRIVYSTVPPAGVPNGSTFANSVTADGEAFLTTTARYQSGFGDGEGDVRTGSVSWTKSNAAKAPLAGSEWSLVGPDGTVAVVDNGAKDANSVVGALEVTGLVWGDYVLTETKAPAGYVLDAKPYKFTVSGDALNVNLGDVVNVPVVTTPPTTPPTTPSTTPATTPPTTPATTPPVVVTTPPTTPSAPPLAYTGTPSSVVPMGIGAGVLVLLGIGITVLMAQKRRQH